MNYFDLQEFFKKQKIKVIIAADAEPRVSQRKNGSLITGVPAGGVAVVLDSISKASNATFIGRGKTQEDKEALDSSGKIKIEDDQGWYYLRRLFFNQTDYENYYFGFSNQTLWPLCHVAFESPLFRDDWYEGYHRINKKYAEEIKKEINGRTLVFVNDYQLTLVPKYLGKQKNVVMAMFWHIPWPTWEVFRILPQKKEILESMLLCDFIGFHRNYQVRNFLDTVARELEARIDEETGTIHYNNHTTVVKNLPLGIDTDTIESLTTQESSDNVLVSAINKLLGISEKPIKTGKETEYDNFFQNHKVILGVDRLDYTKGLVLRLRALERFFDRNPKYKEKVIYMGILAPSREKIPAYEHLRKQVKEESARINAKFKTEKWQPINLIFDVFNREELIHFYERADVCLVTPRDDGMNLVSKEFVLASSFAKDPGMLVLSMFAGSAIDLTKAIIVNPYDIDQVAAGIKEGLEMSKTEKIRRMSAMAEILKERNVYQWAEDFVRSALSSVPR